MQQYASLRAHPRGRVLWNHLQIEEDSEQRCAFDPRIMPWIIIICLAVVLSSPSPGEGPCTHSRSLVPPQKGLQSMWSSLEIS